MFYWSAKQNHVTCGCMTPIPNWKLHQNKTILEFTLCFSVSKECHVKTMLATNVFYFGYHICCCVHLNDFQRCVFLTILVTRDQQAPEILSVVRWKSVNEADDQNFLPITIFYERIKYLMIQMRDKSTFKSHLALKNIAHREFYSVIMCCIWKG